MDIPIYCFLKTCESYYLDSVLPARWCSLSPAYTCLKGVALAQHSEAALTPRVIHMFECVCVRGKWDHYSFLAKKLHSALPPLETRIWINAHWSRACWRGRPRGLTWSVCTHCRRLPTVVASERFVSVWATGRKWRLFVSTAFCGARSLPCLVTTLKEDTDTDYKTYIQFLRVMKYSLRTRLCYLRVIKDFFVNILTSQKEHFVVDLAERQFWTANSSGATRVNSPTRVGWRQGRMHPRCCGLVCSHGRSLCMLAV